jgi:hypothetical protein
MALQAGTRLGPYEVLSLIGAGGMGEVYQARDTRLDRKVAVKVLAPEYPVAEYLRERQARARYVRPTSRLRAVPSAKMSVRASAAAPCTCSGAMYWSVPMIVPCAVPVPGAVASIESACPAAPTVCFARPKSSNLVPAAVSMMFPGFRSRWTMPCRCAVSRASAISVPVRGTRCRALGRCRQAADMRVIEG